jgi:dsDNA-specific endonuclease/ATPase MutS2
MPALLTDVDTMAGDVAALNAHAMEINNKIKPLVEEMHPMFADMKRTQDSANMVLKDSVDKLDQYNKRIGYLERIDLEKKLSELSRKLIAEIVRENLMPVQTNYNMELKGIKRIVDEQRDML